MHPISNKHSPGAATSLLADYMHPSAEIAIRLEKQADCVAVKLVSRLHACFLFSLLLKPSLLVLQGEKLKSQHMWETT